MITRLARPVSILSLLLGVFFLTPGNLFSQSPIRINAGGPAYTDPQGRTWSADTGYDGGSTFSTATAIAGTDAPALYRTLRWKHSSLRYQFSLPGGNYRVRLKFAELVFTAAGKRVFNIDINGQRVLSNFDIVAAAAGAFRAIDKEFRVAVAASQLTIDLKGVVENPMVNALEIVPETVSGVAVSVSPATVTLSVGQTQQFTASVSGTSDTRITWTLSPLVGTISGDGRYTAPSSISSNQTVTVKASSVADPTKSATAAITLVAVAVAVSVSPANVSLTPSQTQQFTASVSGSSDARVTWSLSAPVGSISSAGLYTAPLSITGITSLQVIATSVADSSKSGVANVTLSSGISKVVLPVEVMGPNGTTRSVEVDIPATDLTGTLRLWLQIHGLDYQDKGSVQVNSSAWMSINASTAALEGLASAYGGIGGGFSTLKLTLNLPAGTVVTGKNRINFRFNFTNGVSSGFRVLRFNILRPDATKLISETAFVQDDPALWPVPYPAEISEGARLWREASLTVPTATGVSSIRARCSDCHAQDGRDLKYFNYSNHSIRVRSMFHGLSQRQGDQIASYIRTLAVPNPGRPWNPPYQPGPGLDSKPVTDWAAGAGLDAVLNSDTPLMNEIFPSGIQDSAFSAAGNLNIREVRIPFQLPDWNQWLPRIHPMDAFGDTFLNHDYNSLYHKIRAALRPLDATAYASQALNIRTWVLKFIALKRQIQPSTFTPELVNKVYSLPLWGMVKTWEMKNEFQLEGLARTIFTHPEADSRAWIMHLPFLSSPHMLQIPATGLRNGKESTRTYLAYIWYHSQLILNNSNKELAGHNPVDWPYTYGFTNAMSRLAPPQPALHYLWLIKALQVSNNGKGPEYGAHLGWQWSVNDLSRQVHPETTQWKGISPSLRVSLSEGMIRAWLAEVKKFTPQQFYKGGWTTSTAVPTKNQPDGDWPSRVWYMIPQYRYAGVSQTLIDQLADWAKTIWPNADWDATKTATCSLFNGGVVCSTQK